MTITVTDYYMARKHIDSVQSGHKNLENAIMG